MTIRAFREQDAESVVELIHRNLLEVNRKDYPPETIQELVAYHTVERILAGKHLTARFVADEEGRVVGTAALARYEDGDAVTFYAATVFVLPECHGRGIGAALMAAVEAAAQAANVATLWVSASITAQGFYRKLGFHEARPSGERGGGGEILMDKPLGQ